MSVVIVRVNTLIAIPLHSRPDVQHVLYLPGSDEHGGGRREIIADFFLKSVDAAEFGDQYINRGKPKVYDTEPTVYPHDPIEIQTQDEDAMSIKTFNAFHVNNALYIQTALTAVHDPRLEQTSSNFAGLKVGWVTQVLFGGKADHPLPIELVRLTTLCSEGKNGPVRKLKGYPQCVERVFVQRLQTTVRTNRYWYAYETQQTPSGRKWKRMVNEGTAITQKTEGTVGWDFGRVMQFRDGWLKANPKDRPAPQAFFDYLTEESPLSSYITGPGVIPYTWVEMREFERQARESR